MSSETSESSQPPVGSLLAISDATVISRSPSALAAEVDGELLMMSIESGAYFSLNEVGRDIWHRIEPPCLFGELIDSLAMDYDAAKATIAQHVWTWLTEMAAENIVRLV